MWIHADKFRNVSSSSNTYSTESWYFLYDNYVYRIENYMELNCDLAVVYIKIEHPYKRQQIRVPYMHNAPYLS